MKSVSPAKLLLILGLTAVSLLPACRRAPGQRWQGYLEGDFVYVSSPIAGRLDQLLVAKGHHVAAHTPLFRLEQTAELAAQRQAAAQLASAQAKLADVSKGARPSEIAALEARVRQAKDTAELSRLDLERQQTLFISKAISQSEFDHARLTDAANHQAVDQAQADLATGQLAGRPDSIASAEALVAASAAALDSANWAVNQKTQSAPADALVFDTLYRQGEFVGAGLPVVSLLPPENLKVRFFVPEAQFALLKAGDTVQVSISGHADPLTATVSYLAPQAEYSPPVLYNRDNREKLVYLVEAVFTPEVARTLHPGQPVDVAASR